MYQLDEKPKERNANFLSGYHGKMSSLYNDECIWDSMRARENAEKSIYDTKDELSDKGDEKDDYFYQLGKLWACHDYLEGADQ